MAILKIARMGNPILRKMAEPIPAEKINTPEIQRLINDMMDTVVDADGAGLAAPQVHVSKRLVILSLQDEEDFQVWINPVLTPSSEDYIVIYEGCLSIPGMRGAVARPDKVFVQALDRTGNRLEFELEGMPAVVAQHECDHLNGILYVDRVLPKTMTFLEEYGRYGAWALELDDDDEEDSQ